MKFIDDFMFIVCLIVEGQMSMKLIGNISQIFTLKYILLLLKILNEICLKFVIKENILQLNVWLILIFWKKIFMDF